jgi:hypothetical protein
MFGLEIKMPLGKDKSVVAVANGTETNRSAYTQETLSVSPETRLGLF